MEERFREQYFVLLRIVILLLVEGYILFSQSALTGASAWVLLILALFIGVIAGKEFLDEPYRLIGLLIAGIIWLSVTFAMEMDFSLLGVYLCYEALSYFKTRSFVYLLPLTFCLLPDAKDIFARLVIAALIGFCSCRKSLNATVKYAGRRTDT